MAGRDRYAGFAIAGLAGALVVAGLVLVGGPGAGQAETRDRQRAADLRQLDSAVLCRVAAGVTPAQIGEDMQIGPDARCGDMPDLRDPLTGAAYDYEVIEARRYRHCASFERPDRLGATRSDMQFEGARGCLVGGFSR